VINSANVMQLVGASPVLAWWRASWPSCYPSYLIVLVQRRPSAATAGLLCNLNTV